MTEIIHTDREQWLACRRTLVMASEAAAILGLDPRRGQLAVYAEKIEGLSVEENKLMKWGRRVEGAIAEGYEDETGRKVHDRGMYTIDVHPDVPWLGATLDRDIIEVSEKCPLPAGVTGPGALEAKAVAGFKAKEWAEEPPDQFLVQLQIQLACTGREWGSLCALMGGINIVFKDIPRHDRFLAAALPKLEEFRMRVLRRDPPPADGTEGTTEAIKRLWPKEDGETLRLGAPFAKLVKGWESAKDRESKAEKEKKAYENEIRRVMGAASFATLPDRTWIHNKRIDVEGYVKKVEAFNYRRLFHKAPQVKRGR